MIRFLFDFVFFLIVAQPFVLLCRLQIQQFKYVDWTACVMIPTRAILSSAISFRVLVLNRSRNKVEILQYNVIVNI
jgi:hypothetical protein